MQDLRYNPSERDMIISNGDFSIADDESTGFQNGFIIAGTDMASTLFPSIGMSLVYFINGSTSILQLCINWKNMCKLDGATDDTSYKIQGEQIQLKAVY